MHALWGTFYDPRDGQAATKDGSHGSSHNQEKSRLMSSQRDLTPRNMINACRDYLAQVSQRAKCAITIQDDKAIIHADERDKIYIPTATGQLGHNDNSFVRLIMGPYGSGKSTWCVNEIVRRTCSMPAWHNGRRRARWGIVRNTSGELQSTTLQTWLTWFGGLGDIHKRQKPLLTYEHTFNDGKGVIELELIFIALDREEDLRKIKSLELTGCYINELSEVPQGALSHLKGRVNKRYPSRSFCPDDYWSGIICDTNPPSEDSWIYKDFELKQLDSYRIFKQPPGLLKDPDTDKWMPNPNCDNANNLAADYYLKLAEGQSEDFVKVFCLGMYGLVGFGKLVYPEFNDSLHSVDNIEAIQGESIHLFWDFGLTPRCLVLQLSNRGQLRALKEYLGNDMGIKTFAESIVIPGLQNDFPYCKVGYSDADPAGNHRSEIMEEMSSIGVLNDLGITTEAASTNDIEPRLNAVRFFLNRMIDGKPGFILSRKGCPELRKGFIQGYVYKRVAIAGEERYRNEPDKNMSSHIQDCLQYGALRFASTRILDEKKPKNAIDMWNPVARIM